MSAALDHQPKLGEGLYSFPQAARILARPGRELTPRQLRYWARSGVVPPSYSLDGERFLSFHDLISLEVVARFRSAGWSLQGIRKIEEELRAEYGSLRPFAHRWFYTDGMSLWARKNADDNELIELIGKKATRNYKPLAWEGAVVTFADEIRFGGTNSVAVAWDLSPWVEIDPEVQYGSPVVRGTRIPASTILSNLEVGTPGEVADWYGISLEAVKAVRDYGALKP